MKYGTVAIGNKEGDKMKKLLFIILCCIHMQAQSHVKIFVNNTSRTYTIVLQETNRQKTSVTLQPGSLKTIFFKSKELSKITLQYSNNVNSAFSSLTNQIFKKEDHAINSHTLFVINPNSRMYMYKTKSELDTILEQIGDAYQQGKPLPKISTTIYNHTPIKGVTPQTIDFYLSTDR